MSQYPWQWSHSRLEQGAFLSHQSWVFFLLPSIPNSNWSGATSPQKRLLLITDQPINPGEFPWAGWPWWWPMCMQIHPQVHSISVSPPLSPTFTLASPHSPCSFFKALLLVIHQTFIGEWNKHGGHSIWAYHGVPTAPLPIAASSVDAQHSIWSLDLMTTISNPAIWHMNPIWI